jgi:hypothetical protein
LVIVLSFLFVDTTFGRSIRIRSISEPELQMLEMLNGKNQPATDQQAPPNPDEEGVGCKAEVDQSRFALCDSLGQLQTHRGSIFLGNPSRIGSRSLAYTSNGPEKSASMIDAR